MKKLNPKGFSPLEVLLIVVILGLIAGVGYYVFQARTSTNNTEDTTKSQTPPQNNEDKEDTATDPYEGWKSYCDDKAKLCFKHPADWTIDSDYSEELKITSATLTNKATTARVIYSSNYEKDGGKREVIPVKLENHKGLTNFSVVGTASQYLGNYRVDYDVINGTVEDNGFKIGEGTTALDNPRFTLDGISYKFSGWALKDANTNFDFKTIEEAKKWFDSENAKTILLIMQSLNKK